MKGKVKKERKETKLMQLGTVYGDVKGMKEKEKQRGSQSCNGVDV